MVSGLYKSVWVPSVPGNTRVFLSEGEEHRIGHLWVQGMAGGFDTRKMTEKMALRSDGGWRREGTWVLEIMA